MSPDQDPFAPTPEEFAQGVNQLYPEAAARVFAEIRASKMSTYIDRLHQQAAEAGSESPAD